MDIWDNASVRAWLATEGRGSIDSEAAFSVLPPNLRAYAEEIHCETEPFLGGVDEVDLEDFRDHQAEQEVRDGIKWFDLPTTQRLYLILEEMKGAAAEAADKTDSEHEAVKRLTAWLTLCSIQNEMASIGVPNG